MCGTGDGFGQCDRQPTQRTQYCGDKRLKQVAGDGLFLVETENGNHLIVDIGEYGSAAQATHEDIHLLQQKADDDGDDDDDKRCQRAVHGMNSAIVGFCLAGGIGPDADVNRGEDGDAQREDVRDDEAL